jgi:hypothetical protein
LEHRFGVCLRCNDTKPTEKLVWGRIHNYRRQQDQLLTSDDRSCNVTKGGLTKSPENAVSMLKTIRTEETSNRRELS